MVVGGEKECQTVDVESTEGEILIYTFKLFTVFVYKIFFYTFCI